MKEQSNTQAVTLELPDSLYRAARQAAAATGEPLETVLQASIAHALPPLDDVPANEAADLASLTLRDEADLWQVARSTMSAEEQAELNELPDRQSAEDLAPTGQSKGPIT